MPKQVNINIKQNIKRAIVFSLKPALYYKSIINTKNSIHSSQSYAEVYILLTKKERKRRRRGVKDTCKLKGSQ